MELAGTIYDRATEAELEETVRLAKATGRRIVACSADVRNMEQLQAAVGDGVTQLGRLHIVSANAGDQTFPADAGALLT